MFIRNPDTTGRQGALSRPSGQSLLPGIATVVATEVFDPDALLVDPGFDIVDMGFDDYLLKPVERARLEETVAETLASLGEREAVREYRSVASKVAALRVKKNAAELEGNDEYERLLDRLRELESEVDLEGVETQVDI